MVENEDIKLVKEYILLPVLLQVIEKNLNKIKTADLKLSEIFELQLEIFHENVLRQMRENRQSLRKRGIKILTERRTTKRIEVKYLCRGYAHNMSLLWMLVRSETMTSLCSMMGLDISKLGDK